MREFKTARCRMSRRGDRGYNEERRDRPPRRLSGDSMNRYLSILLAVALVLGLGTNSWAGAPTEQLRTYTDQILKVLESPGLSLPEKREAVRKIASEVFDTMETAQRVLAQHWQQRTPPDAEEFANPFANLLEQPNTRRIDEYDGE